MLLAFLFSLLLHLLTLGGGLLSFDAIDMPEDPTLRKLSVRLDSMQLEEASAPALETALLTTGPAGGRHQDASQPLAARKKRPRPVIRHTAASAPVASMAASAALAQAPHHMASASVAAVPASAAVAATPVAEVETVKPDKPIRHFPSSARVQYALFYAGIAAGRGDMVWQREAGNYSLVTDMQPVIGPKLHYETTGTVGKQGLKPERFEATRNGEMRERAYFDWGGGVLSYGDRNADKSEPLASGAQDWLGLGVQLALRGDNMGDAPIQITTGKKVYSMLLKPDGETDFDTGDGVIRAVVVRVKQPDEMYEFWLAPDFANIPIRVLRVGKDARYEMRANLIELAGKTVWKLPPRKLNHNESKR
ncbi:DUF3108 domain-containing protein [Vogesella sp. GCM10023246]|uniref:DUF3108 domain-containing protein n=1 Tax=Vogesella oryzagri TaxID=3160864 RepID=A0ABV1M766_9NEIS